MTVFCPQQNSSPPSSWKSSIAGIAAMSQIPALARTSLVWASSYRLSQPVQSSCRFNQLWNVLRFTRPVEEYATHWYSLCKDYSALWRILLHKIEAFCARDWLQYAITTVCHENLSTNRWLRWKASSMRASASAVSTAHSSTTFANLSHTHE